MASTDKRVLNFSAGPAKLPEEVSVTIFNLTLISYFISLVTRAKLVLSLRTALHNYPFLPCVWISCKIKVLKCPLYNSL